MGTQIADLYAKIGADTSELDKGLSHAQGAMGQAADAMGGALDSVSARAVALGVTLGNIATAGLSQLTQAVTGLASGMVSGNAEFERYQTQFTVLLKSADAAKQRLAKLAEFGKVTPFELPEVVQADKILQAFGLHAENVAQRFGMAGDEIRTVAGDVAAGTGASFTEISTYLGKFASGATGEAIARMQELGITTRDELKQMGLEFSKSGELISPLDKSMTVLLQAMKTKFGGMMDAQSQTFEGMMSNLKDWFGQAQRLAGEPLFKALKDQLQSLLDLLNSPAMTQGIQQLAAGIGEGVSRAIEAFKGAIQGFKSAGLGGAATGILSALGLDDKAASMVGGVINQIVSVVQTGMAMVQAAFEAAQPYLAVLGDALMSAVPVVATLADLLGKALAGALNALGTVVQFVMEHWQPFAAALAVVAGLLAGAGIAAAVAGIGAALSALGAAVGVAVAAIGALLTPIGLLIAGVALLAVAWANNWGDIQGIAFRVVATVQALIAALGGSMSAIGEGLRVALTKGPAAGYAAFQKSMQGVNATYQQAIAAVPQRGKEMQQGFAASWDSTIATVKDKLGGMFNAQNSGLADLVANAQQRAAEIRLALAGAQGASLATISNSFAPGQITAGMEADFVKAEATGRSLTPKAKQAAAAVVAPIKAFNTGVVSGLGGGGGGAGSKAAKTVEEQILEAANVIRNVTETVAKLKEFLSGGELSKLKSPEGADQIIEVAVWVTDLGKRMAEEFRAAAGGFKEEGNKAAAALADAIGSATSAIGNVAGMLVKLGDLMKHDKWPDMQANMGRMQEIAQQLLQFGLGLAQTLVPAAQGMSEDAAKSAQYMAQAIQAAAQATSAVADLLPKLWEFTQRPEFDDIMASRKELQAVAKKLIAWGKDLAKTFVGAAKGMSESAAKSAQNLATAITSATSSVTAVIDLLPKLLDFSKWADGLAALEGQGKRQILAIAKSLIAIGVALEKEFVKAAGDIKDKSVAAAKRLSEAIQETAKALQAVLDIVPRLLDFGRWVTGWEVVAGTRARADVVAIAGVLIALGRSIADEFAAASRDLSGYSMAGVKALGEGIQTAGQALDSVMTTAANLLNFARGDLGYGLISQQRVYQAVVWLADVLGTLGRTIFDSFAVASRNLSSYTVAGARSLADGIDAASDALGNLMDTLPRLLSFISGSQWATWDRIARDQTQGGIVNTARVLAGVGAALLAQMVPAAATWGNSLLIASVKSFADGVGAVTSVLSDLMGVLPDLLSFISGSRWAVWDRIARDVAQGGIVNTARVLTEIGAAMMQQMHAAASTWSGSGLTQAMQDLRDSIGAAVETLGGLMDVLPRLLSFISGSQWATWDRIATQGRGAIVDTARALTEIGTAMMQQMQAAASVWSDAGLVAAIQSLRDGLGAAAETLNGLMGVLPALLDFVSGKKWATWQRLASEGPGGTVVFVARTLTEIGAALMAQMHAAAAVWSDAGMVTAIQSLRDGLGAAVETLGGLMDVLPRLLDFVSGKKWATWQRLASEGPDGTVVFVARTLADIGVALLQQMRAAVAAWDGPAISETVQSLADAIGSTTDLLTRTIELVTQLIDLSKSGFPTIDPAAAAEMVINPIVTMAKALAARISAAMGEWVPVETEAGALQGILGDGLGVIRDTLAFVQQMIDLSKSGFPTVDAEGAARLVIDPIVAMAKALAVRIVAAVGAWQATETNAGNLSTALSDGLGVIDNTLAFVQRLIDLGKEGFPTIDAEGAAALLINPIVAMAKTLAQAANAAAGVMAIETNPALTALNDILGTVGGLVDGVLSLFRSYMDAVKDEVPYSDTEVQAAVTDMVGLVIRYAKTLAETARTAMGYAQVMAIPALDKLGDAVGQIGSVVDGVLSLFRSYMDALTDKVQYGDAEVQAAVTNMVGVLIVYARALRNAGAAAMDGIQVDAIPTLDRLGDVLGQLSSVTGSVLDIFRAYMATVEDKIRFTDADVQANVKGMVGVLVAFGLALRQAALDVLTARDITELEAIPALEQLGKAVGDLSGMLGSVFDILRLFMPGDDAVDYGAEAQQRVNDALLGLIGFAVWLADRTSSTLAFYQAETLVINKGLEIVRDAVGTTADMLGSVFDILRLFAVGDDATDYSEAAQQRVEDALIELVSFAAWLANRVNATLDYYQAETIVINKGLETVSKTLSETVSIVTDTLSLSKLSKDMAAYKPMVGHAAIETALGRIIEDAKYVAKLFADKAKDSGLTTELQKAAETLSAVFGDASSAINDTLDMVAKLLDPETVIPSKEQVSGKIAAILGVVDVAVTAFSARASAAAASGMDLAGLSTYASAVKGVFEAIAEVANAVNSYSNINVGRQFLGVESVGFGNIRGALQMIWDLFEDAAQHQDLVQSVTSTLTTALDGLTMLATNKGADAGNAWLAGFTSAIGGGVAVPALAPAGTGTGAGGQVTINNIVNNTRSVNVSVNASTAEASRAGVVGVYSLVMY